MEAGTQVRCQVNDPFAHAAKAHLNACFAAAVQFNPADIDYYKAIQSRLYPDRPKLPALETIDEFVKVPNAPAVVIHAEDHRADRSPRQLLLYLPLDGRVLPLWFNPGIPTAIYLFLYPPGTLIGRRPPLADPSLFEGTVTTLGRASNPITGQKVNAQIADLDRPQMMGVPSGNIPPLAGGVVAQVAADLRHCGEFPLPVYSSDAHHPGVRVDAAFPEITSERVREAVGQREPVPPEVERYYMEGSIVDHRFVFLGPHPTMNMTICLPGAGLYRHSPTQAIRELLVHRYPEIEVDPAPVETHPYVYQVRFVFMPPRGTHGPTQTSPMLFE